MGKKWDDIIESMKYWNWKIMSTTFVACVVYLSVFFCAYKIGSKEVIPITYICCISGFVLGWIVGLITSPYDKDDKDRLSGFTKTIGTFLSGYILSKFDKVFDKAVDPKLLLTDLMGARLLLSLCSFGVTWIIVFVYRSYIFINEKKEGKTPKV